MTPKKTLLWALIFGWLVATVALAGPSWIKRPTPVEKNQNALVILLDLSISMYSEDIKPSRIARARLKITDILRERKDGQTAIVVYAGEAHTVTPLSDDSATIISLLPSLQPNIMPLQGSNTEAAVARGIQLLKDVGAAQGDLLLVTDGIVPDAFAKIRELVAGTNVHLNILGVGTNQPTPVPGSNGSFLHDKQGAILTTQLNSSELKDLAAQIGGRYHEISNTNNDIDYLIPDPEKNAKNNPTLERDFDQWFDQGHWLVFLLLPIVLFSFRRGFILMLICIPLIGLSPSPAYAFTWDDLWLTKDQQAARELSKGDVKAAAEKFETPDWKASAEYRTGNYSAAAEHYAKSDTAEAHYNRGNALAKAGKLEDAIKAYDAALSRDAALD
ncbi:MAG: VWA domain-containing protein, partial [Moraxellaceae bacterium]